MRTVTAKWALENKDTIQIIDVRGPEEYAGGHIEGSRNIPMTGLLLNPEEFLNKHEEYYLICRSGGRSLRTATKLEEMGYQVVNCEGGNASIGKADPSGVCPV